MNLKRLQYFVAVVESGTITSAAEKLNLSQPPLTAQIHLLEQSLGCMLFERTGRRLYLTEAGKTLYNRAKIIIDLCNETLHELADYRDGVRGILRIGVVSSLCEHPFLDWMHQFSDLHHHIRYELHEANTYSLIEKLQNQLIDIALVRTPFSSYGTEQLSLGCESMMAVGNRKFFSVANDNTISLAELTHTPLIIYRRWENILRGLWEQQGLSPYIFCVNDSSPTTLSMAKNNLGVGLLPASAVREKLPDTLCAIPLREKELSSERMMVLRSYRDLSEAAKSFVNFLKQNALTD